MRVPVQVSDTVFVPISAHLNYFQAHEGSLALPNSIYGLYRPSPHRPKRVLNLVTDFAGTLQPYCADGTTLPAHKINELGWAVYYEIPDKLPVVPLLWYLNSVLTPFRKKREVILIYKQHDYLLYYSTRTGIVQSDIEIFFDDTPLTFKKSMLRAKGNRVEWWQGVSADTPLSI